MQKFGVEVFEPMGVGEIPHPRGTLFGFPLDLLDRCSYRKMIAQRKYDGTQALPHKLGCEIVMPGRSWKTDFALNSLYADIVKELRAIPVDQFILASELTFFDADGVDRVRTANSTVAEARKEGLIPRLMVFDVISLMGQSARTLPLSTRIEMLQMLLAKCNPDHVRVAESYRDYMSFPAIYDEIVKSGGEGLILKPLDSQYVDGEESLWIKVKKSFTEDCVIIGMTKGEGSRADKFGSLILAQLVNGKLQYVGKAGTGLDAPKISRLHEALKAIPEAGRGEYDIPIPPKEIKKLVKPKLVAEIKFMNRTKNGILRMPVFVRERDDKTPKMCEAKS